jgi:hypothetical protein
MLHKAENQSVQPHESLTWEHIIAKMKSRCGYQSNTKITYLHRLSIPHCREKSDDDRIKVVTTIEYLICYDISLNNCENIVRRKEIRVI